MINAKHYGAVGEHLIILHGLFGNSDNWHTIATSLSEHFQVHCLDLPNHGQSSALRKATYPKMAERIYEWMQSSQIETSYILGHSMGGKVAMQLATEHAECVKKLIVADIAPVNYLPRHQQIFAGLFSIKLDTLMNRHSADSLLAEFEPNKAVRQFLLKNLTKSVTGFRWNIELENLFESYDSILAAPPLTNIFTNDTLFIKGEQSDYILAEHKEAILAHFPNTSVKVINGTGHWLHAEKPPIFTSLVRRFLTT